MSKNISEDKSKGNPKAASTRIQSKSASTLSTQIRHDLRRGPQPKYVDGKRSHLNRVLIQNAPIPIMRAICAERRSLRDTERAIKSNAAISTAGVITFGAEAAQMFEALSIKDQDRAFKLLTRLIARRLATSVHGLTVHMDEATIHAHYQLAAINKFGDPLSKSTSPRVMSELQDITALVMQRFCPEIERGRKYGERIANGADFADTIHKSVRELHRDLPADLEAKRGELAALADEEVAAQGRVDEMQARVAKLQDKADLTDREVKRLKTYESRLSDRLDELKVAQATSEAARVEAERLAEIARTDRSNEEDRAGKIRAKADAVADAVLSLNDEISSGTIRRTSDGKITAAAPDRLKPAFPEIRPAVNAAADLVTGINEARSDMDTDRRQLAEDQRDLIAGQYELMRASEYVDDLRRKLSDALSKVARWLNRTDLPKEAKAEAMEIARDSHAALSPPKDPVDDAGPSV